ncbi:FG-GAP and VCBS repeat-containing protein [Streptomyces sp. NPDC001985]|uniref:FG-GAP and VCBS repeat-containing protein n=1 Tax=Streptomyces sp. NPDC001985 TaxID=3154406 RepID=UPI003324BD31
MNSLSVARALGPALAVAVTLLLVAPVGHAATVRGPSREFVAPPQTTVRAQPEDDFNGDGYQDLTTAAPFGTVDGEKMAGYVAVLYGSASGATAGRRQILHQNTPGIPGVAAAEESYGTALTSADLDQDRFADLVVGSPNEGSDGGGTLSVIWGGPKGLTGGTALLDGSERRSGSHIVTGDFDGDRVPDVATTGHGGELWVLSGPFDRDGSPARTLCVTGERNRQIAALAAGDVTGDGITDVAALRSPVAGAAPALVFWKGTPEGPASVYTGGPGRTTVRGETLDIGDVNQDGFKDLVVGHTRAHENEPPVPEGGMITYVPGAPGGPATDRAGGFHQGSPGVAGDAGPSDRFGSAVSVGDIDGDGYEDIAVGAEGKTVGESARAGAVFTLPGGPAGPTGAGARSFVQGRGWMRGTAETDDRFGAAARLIDTDADGETELAVSAPGENGFTGAVWVFRPRAAAVSDSFVYGPRALRTPPAWGWFGKTYTG